MPKTWQTSAEICVARVTDPELRTRPFYTANFAMYRVEDGEAVLYFGGREANPLMAHMEEAASQLIKTGNYLVPAVQRDAVLASVNEGTTLKVNLADLDLKGSNDEFSSFFTINTAALDTLNPAQRALASRVYGKKNALQQYMGFLAEANNKETRIYVLNPDYVKKKIRGNAAVAQACWLKEFFVKGSIFDATFSCVYVRSAVRGVRRVVAEGDAQKLNPLQNAYNLVLAGIAELPDNDAVKLYDALYLRVMAAPRK
ncbi:hypothetical protein HZB02_03475 [Candidatus Woesearchaeota archaeon]|nr:hypothetical protein [Candidatus Woesearchaeota archaeon]